MLNPNAKLVDDAFVEAVEEKIGIGSGAWDIADPIEICRAVLSVMAEKQAEAGQ